MSENQETAVAELSMASSIVSGTAVLTMADITARGKIKAPPPRDAKPPYIEPGSVCVVYE